MCLSRASTSRNSDDSGVVPEETAGNARLGSRLLSKSQKSFLRSGSDWSAASRMRGL